MASFTTVMMTAIVVAMPLILIYSFIRPVAFAIKAKSNIDGHITRKQFLVGWCLLLVFMMGFTVVTYQSLLTDDERKAIVQKNIKDLGLEGQVRID